MAEGVDGAAAICCFMTSDYFVSYFIVVFLALAIPQIGHYSLVEDVKAECYDKRAEFTTVNVLEENSKKKKKTKTN